MLFSANIFLFVFLPMVLAVYYLSPRKLRNPVLLLFSLIFYGWGEPVYLFLMLAVIAMDYACGRWILYSREHNRSAKLPLIAGIAANLLILGYFKYANLFFGDMLPHVPLPIGISFYIFQSMSYIVDVYRNQASVQKNLLTFGTYVTLFPQLIAGPIVRYTDVEDQLDQRIENTARFASGVNTFLVGLSKKMLLANPMGSLWNQLQQTTGTAAAWMGLLAYTMQIYFDFSGYSDMAIGLGRMFGFEFPENFRYPYISASITEFWRRWHISLSTWFREYVYIPLGGNRKGLPRQIRNMLVVWLLTGLWHGASWNFVLWGGYYALLLIFEKCFLLKKLRRLPSVFGHLYTMLAVMLGWVMFYFEDMHTMGAFFQRLIMPLSSAQATPLLLGMLPLTGIAVIAATPLGKMFAERMENRTGFRAVVLLLDFCAMLLCVAALASRSYNPFIYFRF